MGNLVDNLKDKWPNKFTLSESQSASGAIALNRIDQMNDLRIIRDKKFIESINKFTDKLIFNSCFNNRRHVYHLLTAYVRPNKLFSRDSLIKSLYFHHGIQCIVQYYI
jgi:dTDP-4-amino-4,6-dideoxygalactose transaminase